MSADPTAFRTAAVPAPGSTTGIRRAVPAALAGAALALVLAGCSSPAPQSTPAPGAVAPSSSSTDDGASSGSTGAPLVVDLDDANGSTITVGAGGYVTLDTDDEADWSASIADPALAEFIPGTDGSGTETDPGLRALAEGTTQVTITELPGTDDADDLADDDDADEADDALDVIQFTLIITG